MMTRWTIPAFLGVLLVTAAPVASAAPAAEPGYAEANGVVFNFNINPLFRADHPFHGIECRYPNALRQIDGEGSGTAKIYRLKLSKETIEKPSEHERCERLYSNLTNLEQHSVQQQIGEILAQMNCEPGAEVEIFFDMLHNRNVKNFYPDIPHENVVRRIRINNCLTQEDIDPRTNRPRLDENGDPIRVPRELKFCSMPCRGCGGNGLGTIIEYSDMLDAFERCRNEVNKIVEDEKLLEQWAQRQPQVNVAMSEPAAGGLSASQVRGLFAAGFSADEVRGELERQGYAGGVDAPTLRGLREAGADAGLIAWIMRNGR